MIKADEATKINMILEKICEGNTPDCFKLWACRGEGKGCDRNKYRKAQKHCEDCVEAIESETLGELQERLQRKG